MAEKYLGIEKYIFTDTYNLFLKYKDMSNTESNWNILLKEASELERKYDSFPLATKMISAVISDLDFKLNGISINGSTYKNYEYTLEKIKRA